MPRRSAGKKSANDPRQSMFPGMQPEEESPAPKVAAAQEEELPEDETLDDELVEDELADESAEDVDDSEGPPPGTSVWIVDANSLIFQVFHAIPEMTSPRGLPVNAVYGFARDVMFLLDKKKPDYFFVAFDVSAETFRHELYEDYKAQREEMPDDLRPQIEVIYRMLSALDVPVLGLEGFEADDILATVAELCQQREANCVLVTGDKDCRQLISDYVKVYNVRKNLLFGEDELAEEWGVRPDQVVDFQSLVGDSVDNVPGVPLIGPKIARELLERFDTLDAVLDNADQVSGKKRKQNLIDFRDQALLSRQLVRLDREVPIEIPWPLGRVANFEPSPAAELFEELGFRTFAKTIADKAPVPVEPMVWDAQYELIDSLDALQRILQVARQQPSIALDLETTHPWPMWAELVGIVLGWEQGKAFYIPVRTPEGEPSLDQQAVLDLLRPLLEDPAIEKVGQNLKYETIVFGRNGIKLAGPRFDTMIASYLLDAGARAHGLDHLSRKYLRHETIKIASLIGTGKNQITMDQVPVDQVVEYACEDVDVTLRLRPILEEKLKAEELFELFQTVELPLIDVLASLETVGVSIDVDRLAELSEEYGREMDKVEREIYELAGREFNIASPKQLQEVLFDELKLPRQKRTQSGSSTDASVLEQLAREHPLPAKILDYRQYAKLRGTYLDALPHMVNPQTGRVHASFNQVVAATGRLSSSDPNLQNIPIRTELGKEIRSAFVPPVTADGTSWELLTADYSQVELRFLAHFSEDEALCEAFAREEDIHARVASEVYGVPLEEVTSAQRRSAKAVNFGVIYGLSSWGLARQLNIEQSEATEFIDGYFARYPRVGEFLSKVLADCAVKGYVKTILGRRRAIEGVRTRLRRQRNLPERTAINTVIQGSAADLIKLAMLAIHRRWEQERLTGRMLLQIHDELIFEVPSDQLRDIATLVSEEMAQVFSLKVPLKVDLASGKNWAETHPLA